ncbi:MAG: diadenylate cyclase CdaA [Candidatus Eisenbacteria bacterium]|nr:diadenylate cyclase CdaA [Candidatus Eisenbacteria bacterium]
MQWFREVWILDVLDVAVVAFLFYRLFLLIRGTRAAQMFVGLVVIIIASMISQFLQLHSLNWIVSSLGTAWVVAFVILFQPELRRALALIGQNRFLGSFLRMEEFGVLGEIVKASEEMSQERIGSLIVLERDIGLKNYVETGTRLDARVTNELLVTIFTPNSPLHDGAVIIRGDMIVAAGCILPLSQNPIIGQTLGTRHMAALGIAEETDAVAVVVSAETGSISLGYKGTLKRKLDGGSLRSELGRIFAETEKLVAEESELSPG